jgi:predicted DNA-binding transcriptional regulator YafY
VADWEGAVTTQETRWRIFSKHGLALLHLAQKPQSTARELADFIGVTERQAQRLLADLRRDGYIHYERQGKRHRYKVNEDQTLRHPNLAKLPLSSLINLVVQRNPEH